MNVRVHCHVSLIVRNEFVKLSCGAVGYNFCPKLWYGRLWLILTVNPLTFLVVASGHPAIVSKIAGVNRAAV